jgi:agmatinase
MELPAARTSALHAQIRSGGANVEPSRRESVVPYDTADLPKIPGAIPTFLGARPIHEGENLNGLDVVVAGLPWEGTITWGSYSGCEQTPKACRLASVRYGTGYLPEYDVEVMTTLIVGDLGDITTFPSNAGKTFEAIERAAARCFESPAIPVFLGGDHSVSYPVIKALSELRPGRFGIIHFDAHLDNADEFGGDRYARCCPLRRVAELPGVEAGRIIHVGIHGPRNSPSQMRYAREKGIHLFTMADIQRKGLATVLSEAREIAEEQTDGYYVTVCSDIVDHAFNPGGPLDFGVLSSGEMLGALIQLGQGPLLGLDVVEVYPRSDVNEASAHLVAWEVIYALAGVALCRRG